MCLAIPMKVVELVANPTGSSLADEAIVDVGGVRKRISLAFVDGAAVGDYVIVHVGYALQRLDPEEAERTLELFRQALDAE